MVALVSDTTDSSKQFGIRSVYCALVGKDMAKTWHRMAKTGQTYKKDFGVGVAETETSGAVFWCMFGSGHQTNTKGVPNLQFGVLWCTYTKLWQRL